MKLISCATRAPLPSLGLDLYKPSSSLPEVSSVVPYLIDMAPKCVPTLKPLERPTYLTHGFLGHSARNIGVHRQHHDDKPLHQILPVHACTRRPRRYFQRHGHVSNY